MKSIKLFVIIVDNFDKYSSEYAKEIQQCRIELCQLELNYEIWKSENKQVDFKKLKDFISDIPDSIQYCVNGNYEISVATLENLALFFKAMKNPRFATVASKEMRKVSKNIASCIAVEYEIESSIDGECIAIMNTVESIINFYKVNGNEYDVINSVTGVKCSITEFVENN